MCRISMDLLCLRDSSYAGGVPAASRLPPRDEAPANRSVLESDCLAWVSGMSGDGAGDGARVDAVRPDEVVDVCVVVPTRGRADLVLRAVASALVQTASPAE